jgi:hypothetical protein
MERTAFREEFFSKVLNDPYAHMVAELWKRAWVEGYEEALRAHNLTEERLRKSYADRMRDAVEYLTDARDKSNAQAVIAMGQIGSLISKEPQRSLCRQLLPHSTWLSRAVSKPKDW